MGTTMSVAGAVAAFLLKWFWIDPAYTPLADGRYGETFGPVAYFRVPVYAVRGLMVVAGLACVGIGAARGRLSK